jgi:hypothetical protein
VGLAAAAGSGEPRQQVACRWHAAPGAEGAADQGSAAGVVRIVNTIDKVHT